MAINIYIVNFSQISGTPVLSLVTSQSNTGFSFNDQIDNNVFNILITHPYS